MSTLLIGFVFLAISSVSAGDGDDMMPCLELFDPEAIDKMCCGDLESFYNMSKDFDECLKKDTEDWMCNDFQCILKKMGVMKDDVIDDNSAKKFYEKLEEDYPEEKAQIERVRRECLGGKFESYPPEDACTAVKFYVCSYINTFLECDSWKEHDICLEMSENAKKCKKALDGE